MRLKTAYVTGMNTDQKASQAHSLIQDEHNAFFALILLEGDDAFTKARQTVSEIAELYFETEGTPPQKLKDCQRDLEEKLKVGEKLDYLLVAVAGKVMYLLAKGEVEAYLNRRGKVVRLLSVGGPAELISGFLEGSDRVLISTRNLTDHFKTNLSEMLNLPLAEFEDEVAVKIGSNYEGGGMSALLIDVGQQAEASGRTEISEAEDEVARAPVIDPDNTAETEHSRLRFKGVRIEQILSMLRVSKKLVPKGGRGRLAVAAILLIILGAGIVMQFNNSRNKERDNHFNTLINNVRADLEAARGLSAITPASAKEKLESAKVVLTQALSIKPKDQQALDLQKTLIEEEPKILQQFTAGDFPVFLDLDLVKKGFTAQKISLSVGKLLVLDPTTISLVLIDLSKKSNQILAGKAQLGEASLNSLNGSFAFTYSQDKGLIRVDSTNQKNSEVTKADKEISNVVDIYAFASNVYLLDASNNQIWKYVPAGSNYSAKQKYLTDGVKVDLTDAIRMQIESSIYILKRDGEILRFTKGEKDNFSYAGLPSAVKEPRSFFVSSDTENLYLLDSGNSRLLILGKTGEYKGQILGGKFATATDLVVDEISKKVYLLEGSKILTVDLK